MVRIVSIMMAGTLVAVGAVSSEDSLPAEDEHADLPTETEDDLYKDSWWYAAHHHALNHADSTPHEIQLMDKFGDYMEDIGTASGDTAAQMLAALTKQYPHTEWQAQPDDEEYVAPTGEAQEHDIEEHTEAMAVPELLIYRAHCRPQPVLVNASRVMRVSPPTPTE
jgi:hypothetical protein